MSESQDIEHGDTAKFLKNKISSVLTYKSVWRQHTSKYFKI